MEWVEAGYAPLTLLLGPRSVGWGVQIGRMGLVGPILGCSLVRHSVGRKWPLLQSHATQPLPQFPNLAPSGGAYFRFRLSAAICDHCRIKLSRVGPPGLGKTDQENLSLGVALAGPRGGDLHALP